MQLSWQDAPSTLAGLVVGFVERIDGAPCGASLELPLASPIIQIVLGADYALEQAGGLIPLPPVSLWGCSMRARHAQPDGRLHALVVVLTYRGAALLTGGLPLAGRLVDLAAAGGKGWGALRDRLLDAPSFDMRIALIETFLCGAFRQARDMRSGATLAIADAVATHRVGGSVTGLATRFAVTERTLRNRFVREIGCSPKRLLRLARLGRTVRALHPRPWGGRPAHDVRLEYFDDSHLSREFRALTTLSPADFVRSKHRTGDALVHSLLLETT